VKITSKAWPWHSLLQARWRRNSQSIWAICRGGTLGASLVGLAFVGPSFLMVLAIPAAYVRYGGLPWMQPAFYGIGAGRRGHHRTVGVEAGTHGPA